MTEKTFLRDTEAEPNMRSRATPLPDCGLPVLDPKALEAAIAMHDRMLQLPASHGDKILIMWIIRAYLQAVGTDGKTCPRCQTTFCRPKGTGYSQWEKREFCSRACAEAARQRRKPWSLSPCRSPELDRARRILRTALQKGEVSRPTSCDECGEAPPPMKDGRSSIQAHHHDYSKPLDVKWLCVPCHRSETPLPVGETNGQSKLTAAAVQNILTSPASSRNLSALYGVHVTTIRRVRSGMHWADGDAGNV